MMKESTISLRAAIVLLLVMLLPLWAAVGQLRADEVTAEQARQQALTFLNSRTATAGGPRRAPVAPHQLSQEQQVSGLYVFNVAGNGGFVIVSNDDRTMSVLGYADSGTFDSDNIPSNMRAWLQGYADEIAWVKEHSAATPLVAKAPRREPAATKAAIEPLLTTKWNQDAPYNDRTPYYGVDANGFYAYSTDQTPTNITWYHCATGCVATAMAQVIYYQEWPKSSLPKIPGYNWANYDSYRHTDKKQNDLPAISEIYFNTNNGIAYLMQYCGWSVEMNYGGSSGANTASVATALKTYFGYKETAKYVTRSSYTYANWIELIYHELKEGRPVIYGGQSTDNGHCFVCDGYKCESNTDLFHINWGWSGLSDGYFVLSVLNPSEQGIGGSSSSSAYNYGQEAVIGIQKPSDNGTILDVPENFISIELVSTSASHSTIALGESIDVIVRVRNNSSDVYDGEISLMVNDELGKGEMFEIPTNATLDCVISFTPTSTGNYVLGAAYPIDNGYYACNNDLGGRFVVVDQTPTNLTTSNFTSETATIGWENNGDASKWNLRYRPLTITEEDFNGTTSGWSLINFSTSSQITWKLLPIGGIGDTPCYASASYDNGTDNNPFCGLASPPISPGGDVSFFAWGAGEHFMVLFSSDSNEWRQISSEMIATDMETKYTIELDNSLGPGRVAIIHFNSSGHTANSSLFIDNVTFTRPGEWASSCNVISNPFRLTGLREKTHYELMAQAVNNDGGNWSIPVVFATDDNALKLADDETNNSGKIAIWEGISPTVTLAGRTLYKDGAWNTLCLPFDVTLAVSPLAGATAKTLTDATMTGTTVSLTFGSNVDVLEAGKPYIIKWEKDSGADLTETDLVFPCVTIKAIDKEGRTISKADGHVKFIGYYDSFIINTPDNDDIYYMTADNTLKHTGKERTLKAFRAYFQFSENIVSNARKFVIDYGEGKTTTIESSQLSTLDAQRSEWYTLDGRHLMSTPTKKGIYINGNKKRIVR